MALFGLIILSPIYLLIIVAIKIDSRGSILFEQERVAQNKEKFKIYKFRTMRSDTPHNMPTHLLVNANSFITPVGKFLRRTSLDELPQLLNIIKGDMSIIGPRPCLLNQTDLILERDKYGANDVKPGLTGLAQISGRDELPIAIKAEYDGKYSQRITFTNDCKLFFDTIISVVKHDGIKEGKQAIQKKVNTNEKNTDNG